jgi:uncharacterized membrane protein
MKKTNILWIILDLIFIIIFNTVFFMAGGYEHKAPVWISYAFIHFAYLMLLLTPALIRKGKNTAVFGFPLYSVSSVYFFLELVIGVAFIVISPDGYKIPLLVQIIAAGLYGIVLVPNMIANEYTADAEKTGQSQVDYVKQASAELKGLLEQITDKDAKKKVEKVYDALYSSPVKSHPDLAQTESQILMTIGTLKNAIANGEKENIISLSEFLLAAVNERNRQLMTGG